MVGLLRCVPISVPFSDLLVLLLWATVECTDMVIKARVLSIDHVCVIDICILRLAGTWAVEYSAAEHMASLI